MKRLAETCVKDSCLNHDIRGCARFVHRETFLAHRNSDVNKRQHVRRCRPGRLQNECQMILKAPQSHGYSHNIDNIREGEVSEDASVSCVASSLSSPDSTEHFSAFTLQHTRLHWCGDEPWGGHQRCWKAALSPVGNINGVESQPRASGATV